MFHLIVGLGNPGEEYERTRHNAGAFVVRAFSEQHEFSPWKQDKKLKALISDGTVEPTSSSGTPRVEKVRLMLPQTFMNKSGLSLKPLVQGKSAAKKLVIVYDDLDLPLGRIRISFGRSSGGHKGLESIIRSIGTKDFTRVRVGVSPVTVRAGVKKPSGEKKVLDFIMGVFTKKDMQILEDSTRHACAALATIVVDGREKAMQEYN